jgi:hypothetical protein
VAIGIASAKLSPDLGHPSMICQPGEFCHRPEEALVLQKRLTPAQNERIAAKNRSIAATW